MFKWLIPRETNVFTLFDAHAKLIVEGACTLDALFSKTIPILEGVETLHRIEHEADKIVQTCIEDLHKTFITPIDRDQIFHLISKMDDCLDCMESAAEQLILYRIVDLKPEGKAFSALLKSASLEIASALSLLKNMKNEGAIRKSCALVRVCEKQADIVLRQALGDLFDTCLDPVMIIKWKGIFDDLEKAADQHQHVANIIEGVILEYV